MRLTNGLKATFGSAPGDTVISTYAYTLDGVGNRTNTDLAEPLIPGFETGTINYTYNTGNILATAEGATYTHDANGNRTQKVAGAVTVDYTYDPLNRLTQVADGTNTTQYIYNGLGQRVGKIEDGVQINYLVDPNGLLPQVLAEMDENNNLIAFYIYDGAGLVAKVNSANEYYFYHYDGLGSTVAITDSSAQIVNAYAYSPYGLVGAQETIPNAFTYVGRFGVMAEANGLYYMRARYYDPEVGRFINKDPIGYAGGDLNLYGYIGSNPINFTDPSGLEVWLCNRKANRPIPGNHAYLWDDRPTTPRKDRSCGRTSYWGNFWNGPPRGSQSDKGPLCDPCRKVPNSDGKEQEIMDCCKNTANKGRWQFRLNDCFNAAEICIKKSGLKSPGTPCKRLGPCESSCDPGCDGD